MENPYLVLISGKKQSGKNTIGSYLVKKFSFKEYSFADELKNESAIILSRLTGYTSNYIKANFESNDFKNKPISYRHNKKNRTNREFLQKMGTEWYKDFFNDSLWADILCEKILLQEEGNNPIVITDCRFTDEINTVKEKLSSKYNVIVLRVNRVYTRNIFKRFVLWLKRDTHVSEIALDNYKDFDYIVTNDSDLKDFYFKIDKIRFDTLRKGLEI